MIDSTLRKGLHDCRSSCYNAIQSLSGEQVEIVPPAGLGDAFAQLLANLRQSITSLGLAYKPPVTVPAALQQFEKVSEQVNQLTSCVLVVKGELSREWKVGLVSIENELEKHLDVLEADGDYLASTGKMWEAIDQVAINLSKDEQSAVLKKWRSHLYTVKDAWEEFKGLLEDADDDADDGGWDELGLGEEPLTAEERCCAEAAKPLLALHQLLHASIPKYLGKLSGGDNLDILLACSSRFVNHYDDLVSSLHSQQDELDIQSALDDLERLSMKMADIVKDPSIEKWKQKYGQEKEKWLVRKLDMSSLSSAIE